MYFQKGCFLRKKAKNHTISGKSYYLHSTILNRTIPGIILSEFVLSPCIYYLKFQVSLDVQANLQEIAVFSRLLQLLIGLGMYNFEYTANVRWLNVQTIMHTQFSISSSKDKNTEKDVEQHIARNLNSTNFKGHPAKIYSRSLSYSYKPSLM